MIFFSQKMQRKISLRSLRKEKDGNLTGPFPAILGKGPWLELGKNLQHFGNFLEVFNSKKHTKTFNMCMIYSCVYESYIIQM